MKRDSEYDEIFMHTTLLKFALLHFGLQRPLPANQSGSSIKDVIDSWKFGAKNTVKTFIDYYRCE
uniref:Maturase K n=1 Tax=Romanomermis culicivorax TaxID=13658 RepID=A0A915JD67_ROMCU